MNNTYTYTRPTNVEEIVKQLELMKQNNFEDMGQLINDLHWLVKEENSKVVNLEETLGQLEEKVTDLEDEIDSIYQDQVGKDEYIRELQGQLKSLGEDPFC